jgi:carbon monoxide dehydrogenase subunit G
MTRRAPVERLRQQEAVVALHFEGDKHFTQAPGALWTKLSDARFLVQCIPNAEVNGVPEPATARCKLRPGFAFVRGTLDVTLTIVEKTEPTTVRISLHSKAIGASSDVEAVLGITSKDDGSDVHWTADVTSLGGLLKLVPHGLIRGAAQSVIDDVWKQTDLKLAT